MNYYFPFVFHNLLEKRAIEERVSGDSAFIREICSSREIKSTDSERYLGVHFLFNGNYSSLHAN
jgi:hypothetical protein